MLYYRLSQKEFLSNARMSKVVVLLLGTLLTYGLSLVTQGLKFDTQSSPSLFSNPVQEHSTSTELVLNPDTYKEVGRVLRVVDGDTLLVQIEQTTSGLQQNSVGAQKVRLIGINSPESVDPRKAVECFGREASLFAKKIAEGKKIFLEPDHTQGDVDKYNRLLRYVYVENEKITLNQNMIEEGYAYEYTYRKPYLYQKLFKEVEKNARANKVGLWNQSVCPQDIHV
jgi:micrococcal nuclease